jgi:hypothetical protein
MMALDRGLLINGDRRKSRKLGEKIKKKLVRNMLRVILANSTVQIPVLLRMYSPEEYYKKCDPC